MPAQPQMLIVTTESDPSIDLFARGASSSLINPTTITYATSEDTLSATLENHYDYVYFRDPFNDPQISQPLTRRTTEIVLEGTKHAYHVDHISTYDAMLFEDKWEQYQVLSDYMPSTEILSSIASVDFSRSIVKKRISSRARGIILADKDFPQDAARMDYIVQPRLNIDTEYRVYMIGDSVVLPLAIKSSKTTEQKVKVVGATSTVTAEINTICAAAYSATHYDFMGLDIAHTSDGYFLLEVNRSCQFKGYLQKSGVNLAEHLNQYLLSQSK